MDGLNMISNYKQNKVYRLSFNELAKRVFGIEFERFYQAGFWNDRYICYSYIAGNNVVSNVSVNKMDIVINGNVKNAIQIGTVMTDEKYRGKGLARRLMETVIKEYEGQCEIFYLFANNSVLEFYPKFGFKVQKDYRFYSNICCQNRVGKIRKMNIEDGDDIEKIKQMAVEKVRLSEKFAIENYQGILGWYCMNAFKDNIYFLEDIKTIVFFSKEGMEVNIYDILSKDEISFKEIMKRICDSGNYKVNFHFTPGFKDLDTTCEQIEHSELFIRGEVFPCKVTHPITAHA